MSQKKKQNRLLFSGSRHMLSNVHIICLHNSFPEFFTESAQPQEGLLPISAL